MPQVPNFPLSLTHHLLISSLPEQTSPSTTAPMPLPALQRAASSSHNEDDDHIDPPATTDSLPSELLIVIFRLLCSSSTTLRMSREKHSPNMNAFDLARVCRLWRDIALDLRDIWSTVAVHTPRKSTVNLVKLYLQRSGSLPIKVYLTQGKYDTKPGDSDGDISEVIKEEIQSTNAVIVALLKHARRWQFFNFDFRISAPPRALLVKTTPQDFESVQFGILSVDKSVDVNTQEIQYFWDKVHQAPQLFAVHWARPIFGAPLSAPYAQLVFCIMNTVKLSTLIFIFPQCKQLQVLEIEEVVKDDTPLVSEDMTICLPFLKHLAVYTTPDPCDLLDRLQCPSLQSLLFRDANGAPQDARFLENFLVRSKCSLQLLFFFSDKMEESMYLECLSNAARSLQSLQYCELEVHGSFSTELVRLFMPDKTSEKLPFPMLTHWEVVSNIAVKDAVITLMLKARAIRGMKMRAVSCQLASRVAHVHDERALEELKREGLVVKKWSYLQSASSLEANL